MSVSRFYEIELEKLKVEFEKISIFTNHPGTLGTYREQILKNYIRNFIPTFLSVNSGFVSHYKDVEKDMVHSAQTKQIDLIVHDESFSNKKFRISPEPLYRIFLLFLCRLINVVENQFIDGSVPALNEFT